MNKFDLSKMMTNANEMVNRTRPRFEASPVPLNRTRAEIREDFNNRLKKLDIQAIDKLSKVVIKADKYSEEYQNCKADIEDALRKFLRYYNEFEDLNSEESRKVSLKEQELKLEAKHDWAEKCRLFFFRILASVLFIVSLFTIGYIEKEYDWATLPLSKYVSSAPAYPLK